MAGERRRARGRTHRILSESNTRSSRSRRALGMMMMGGGDGGEEARHFAFIEEQIRINSSRRDQTAMIGFQGYTVKTSEPFTGFHHIVIAYCLLAFLLMYPIVVFGRHVHAVRKRRRMAELQQQAAPGKAPPDKEQQQQQEQEENFVSPPASELTEEVQGAAATANSRLPTKTNPKSDASGNGNGLIHATLVLPNSNNAENNPASVCSAPQFDDGEKRKEPIPVTPTTTKSTLQDETDKTLSESVPAVPNLPLPPPVEVGRVSSRAPHPLMAAQQPSARSSQPHHPHHHHQSRSQVASSSGILSRNVSAATTGRLHSATGIRSSTAAWPRRKHSRRPSGDPSWQWRRAIQTERRHLSKRLEQISQQMGAAAGANGNNGSVTNGPPAAAPTSANSMLFRLKKSSAAASLKMSDLANSVLDAESKEQRTNQLQQQQQQQQRITTKVTTTPHQQQPPPPPLAGSSEAAMYARKVMSMRQHHPRQSSAKSLQHNMMRRPSYSGSARSGSLRSWNENAGKYGYPSSIMSSIVDDISPNDAADADDPGKVRYFPGSPHDNNAHAHRTPLAAACCMAMEPWLDVAELNDEWKRMMGLAFPVTIGALVVPVSRCTLVIILSQLVGTHAMVAFLLVHLLYRMTGETLSVAITDAESTLVQLALTSTATAANSNAEGENQGPNNTFTREGYLLAGQYVQLSCLLQTVLVGTVLILWHTWIEDVVLWWVDSAEIAILAKQYFEIMLVLFLVQAIYRTVMVPCQIRGSVHSTTETVMDVCVTALTLVTICIVLSTSTNIPGEYADTGSNELGDDNVYTPENRVEDSRIALIRVAWTQVIIGILSCVLKFAFCVFKGWMDHFWPGLLRSVAVLNFGALCNLLLSSIPLILGALLELGEVDLLTLFLQSLGPAEVATWALMGSIWDVLEAATEGISEASAIRVAFHLSASQPSLAKKLSHKALFWTVVKALILTSILLLAGRHIIVAMTVDYTLQHILDSLLGLVGLANISMAFAQVCWSLIGAQGRFNLATLIMLVCRWFVTMPMALIFIFGMNYDEVSVAGALAVGLSTSACVLASVLFSSDWNDVAQELYMQGLLSCDEDDDFDFSFGDDEDSEDSEDDEDEDSEDSATPDGGTGSGYPSNKKSLDNDETFELPVSSTEPTSRTGTASGVNSGADSGVISGADSALISGVSGISNG